MDRRYLYSSIRLRTRDNNIASWTSFDIGTSFSKTLLVKRFLPTIPAAELYSISRSVLYTVLVRATTQSRVNGASASTVIFLSIVINETEGFLIVPQSVVPSSMCSLTIIFENSVELPAIKIFESSSGWAVAKYDPDLIEGSIERAIFSDIKFEAGDRITIYGLGRFGGNPCAVNSTVTHIQPLETDYHSNVFHHPIHLEVLHLEHRKSCSSGVLLDDTGKVVGLWLPFFTNDSWSCSYVGVPISFSMPALEELQRGVLPQEPRLLDVLLERVSKNDATAFGVSEGMRSVG